MMIGKAPMGSDAHYTYEVHGGLTELLVTRWLVGGNGLTVRHNYSEYTLPYESIREHYGTERYTVEDMLHLIDPKATWTGEL